MLRIIKLIILVCSLMLPQLMAGSNQDSSKEFESGLTMFQLGLFSNALNHFERVADSLSSQDNNEDLPVVYFLCETCALNIEDLKKAIMYGEKALGFSSLPTEYRILLLCELLKAYDNLNETAKCQSTIKELLQLYSTYKITDIVESVVGFYTLHNNFNEVCKSEPLLDEMLVSNDEDEINKEATHIQLNTIYMCFGKAFNESKDYNKALKYYFKSLDYLTEDTKQNKGTIYSNIADVYNKLGDKKSAIKYQKLSLEED